MKRTFFLLSTAALALAAYLILNAPASDQLAPDDQPGDLDRLGRRIGRWGSKQRLSGAGASLAGNVEEAAGNLLGSDRLAGQGVVDQARGAVKDTAGTVAHAVEGALDDLNR